MDLIASALPPPLIIALHGAVANAATWLPLQRELGTEVEFAAPDLPGHGTRRDENFTVAAALKTVASLIPPPDEIYRRPVVVMGDSLGGYLAILAGAALQRRIDAVVAIGASFPMTGAAGVAARLTDAPVQLAGALMGRERLEGLFLGMLGRLTDPQTREAVAARGLCLASRAQSLVELRDLDMRAALAAIPGPVYVVNGALDLPIRWYTASFARSATDGYAVTIPGAWHVASLTHPRECAEVLRVLLLRLTREAAQRIRR